MTLSKLALLALLPACTGDPEPPAEVPWQVHALSVSDERTLVVAGVGSSVATGSIQTLGTPVPLPYDSSGVPVALDVPIATGVAAGTYHACALSTQQVYCWGDHAGGALGEHRACTPSATEGGVADCILNADIMPTLPAIRAIAAGTDITCATAYDDDRVFCWGNPTLTGGSYVAALDTPIAVHLGDGTPLRANQLTIRDQTVCAIDQTQRAFCWGAGFSDRPQPLELTGVLDLAIGTRHSCAITTSGLACWGDNRNGQVGNADHARRCGDGACTLPVTPIELDAVRVVVGERHTCALAREGEVVCWGSNEVGQLGRRDAFLVGDLGRVDRVGTAVDLQASYARTCALHRDGSAMCWGEHHITY